jgi:hypothetical protein
MENSGTMDRGLLKRVSLQKQKSILLSINAGRNGVPLTIENASAS